MIEHTSNPVPAAPRAEPGTRLGATRRRADLIDARRGCRDPHGCAHPRVGEQCGRGRGDRGEGVISAAIAVLIIAFLGAAMWVGFNTIWEDAEESITEQVDSIGGG